LKTFKKQFFYHFFDMCKAIGYGISIRGVELIGKRGGQRDFGSVELPDERIDWTA